MRIEEFGATAGSDEARALASQLAASNAAILEQLRRANDTLEGIRSDAAQPPRVTRQDWTNWGIAITGIIAGIVTGVLLSQ